MINIFSISTYYTLLTPFLVLSFQLLSHLDPILKDFGLQWDLAFPYFTGQITTYPSSGHELVQRIGDKLR
jgi:hypothetical protein